MAREIPEVVRAAAGLAATVLDEARRLPETLPGLPVRVLGVAMQQAMKVQQQYAGFVARGDELFTGLRGEDEPGLATFDDDIEPVTVTPPGFRDSAFDRAAETSASDPLTHEPTGVEPDGLPADPAADALADAAVEELADQADQAQTSMEDLAAEAPATQEILDELAIDELAGDATATDEGGSPVAAATGVRTDVGGPDTSAEDAAIAEGAAVDAVGGASAAPTDDPQGGSELSGSQAAGAAPIDGYDSFSIAQLRSRLRGYALSTVQDLVVYEEATRARGPYLTMLRNRLEKLEEQAVASSPLAPRGA